MTPDPKFFTDTGIHMAVGDPFVVLVTIEDLHFEWNYLMDENLSKGEAILRYRVLTLTVHTNEGVVFYGSGRFIEGIHYLWKQWLEYT